MQESGYKVANRTHLLLEWELQLEVLDPPVTGESLIRFLQVIYKEGPGSS